MLRSLTVADFARLAVAAMALALAFWAHAVRNGI